MEVNKRRRSSSSSRSGFTITKLMPFCRAVKPSSHQERYENVHYTQTSSYVPHQHQPEIFNNYASTTTPHLPPKVSFLLQPCTLPLVSGEGNNNKDMEKKLNMMAEKQLLIGRGNNEISVDARATSYISSVRERFKLDHSSDKTTTTVITLDDGHVDPP